MNKQKINKVIKYIGWKALGALVFVSVAGTSIWALAAFTEPTTGPSSSVQDFAKNIMGANNSDNDFDSSSVTANSDGSAIERLEDLRKGEYVTCATVFSYAYNNNTTRPTCPNGFVSVKDGFYVSTPTPHYVGWRMCCVVR